MEVPVHVLFTIIALGIALVAGVPFLLWRRRRGA
jgi:cbb3-type cytochrome oxidase subunit 3